MICACTMCHSFLSRTSFTMRVHSRPSQCSSLAPIYISLYTVLSPALTFTLSYTHAHPFTPTTTHPLTIFLFSTHAISTLFTTSSSNPLFHAGREYISKVVSQSIKLYDNEFQHLQSDSLKLITRYFCCSRLLLLLRYVP